MSGDGVNFSRATNPETLAGLGDPERWGGSADIEILVPALGLSSTEKLSPQFLRVQTPDLLARAWDLSCQWQLTGVDPADTIEALSLRCAWGVGQVSQFGDVTIVDPTFPARIVAGTFVNQFANSQGAMQLVTPLSGCAVAVRALLRLSSAAVGAHAVRLSVQAVISPRSLQ